jgi:hypothetical protein
MVCSHDDLYKNNIKFDISSAQYNDCLQTKLGRL